MTFFKLVFLNIAVEKIVPYVPVFLISSLPPTPLPVSFGSFLNFVNHSPFLLVVKNPNVNYKRPGSACDGARRPSN